jgi:hypothetical protein
MVVVVQDQLAVGRYQQIRPSVSVVVRGSNADAEIFSCDTSLRGYIGEGTVVVVVRKGCVGAKKSAGPLLVKYKSIQPSLS